jgi:hypothetical protein
MLLFVFYLVNLTQDLYHLDSGGSGGKTFIPALGAGSINGLIEIIGRNHAK